ncbi:MAG: error-prone DNA polymerase [Mucilaginibacter polytrichastri]|nr:error-prone DNA polymerase [Mucilaginibacter polytrichastri]
MSYTELAVTTNFSFLRGASHPEEMVERAAFFGYKNLAITDRNTLAGVVRAHSAARKKDLRIIPACRLELLDGPPLLAYPTNSAAYSRLSALLTKGNLRAEKGSCHLYKTDVFEHAEGLKFMAVCPEHLDSHFRFAADFIQAMQEYKAVFGTDFYVAANRLYLGSDQKRLFRIAELAGHLGVPMVAMNDVYYHEPQRRELQDILTCVREKCTIRDAGFRLHQNAERYIKPAEEMLRVFGQYPEAIENTRLIAEACTFSLDDLEYVYPEEITSKERSPQQELARLAWQGARLKFDPQVFKEAAEMIRKELRFVKEMNYAPYFLTVHDIVRFARSEGILCQGRGSAANSMICYCLGITSIDPLKYKLLFERFLSSARNEPPDIDVDFEHERREEVIQYIYTKYGRDRAGIVATVTQLHYKGAVRDVGKAMGLSGDTLDRLASSVWSYHEESADESYLKENGLDLADPHLCKVLDLTRQMIGFPRQLGQHTGGFVITQGKLSNLCPVLNARMENRTCIEWNKDDIDALGFLKIDVLALGMLTCIRKCFDLAKKHYGLDLTLDNVPAGDAAVYEMIGHADTIGVFQIESRAQQSMLPRMKPKKFYDLVIEVAIVRPGPIQGDMVHPYLRRRNGEEAVEYPSEALRNILERTLGVPLFQEQAMRIAIEAAGFTPDEADELRRSMATFKVKGEVSQFEKKLISGMLANGYEETFARRVFRQLEGFGSYGFPESHALSFALLVYVSSWLKYHYPDVFACGLLNSMPMGFYQPAQIVIDARKHGVEVRPVDINYSVWDNILEENAGQYRAMRLGFRQIKGIREEEIQQLIAGREAFFTTVNACADAGLSQQTLEKLADADAFRSLGISRREALWEISSLQDRPMALFNGQPTESTAEPQMTLPLMPESEHVIQDYAATSLSLRAHPVSFLREQLQLLHITPASELAGLSNGMKIKVAGLVLVRQRPATASGVCFITLEDETGCANLVVFQKLFDQYRRQILQSRLLMVEGHLQIEGEVIHVVANRCFDLSGMLRSLGRNSGHDAPVQTLSRADESGPISNAEEREATTKNVFYKGRNFH